MAVQAGQLELGMGEHPLDRVGRGPGAEREAELLVLHPGRHLGVRVRGHGGRDPDEHPLGGGDSAASRTISETLSTTMRPAP